MSFNEDELKKIKSRTSGIFKGKSRLAISNSIREYEPRIQAAKQLSGEERHQALLVLLNQATSDRQAALQFGAQSYSNSAWAAAATAESWLQEIMMGDEQEIENVEKLILELRARA